MQNQTQLRSYAQFNQFTVTGRIQYAEIVKGRKGDFLSMTVITNFLNDDDGYTIKFIDSNNMLSMFEQGFLPVGRQITLTGHVDSFGQTYTDQRTGELVMLKRPQMELNGVSIPTGGLGPLPKAIAEERRNNVMRPSGAARQARRFEASPAVDNAPAVEETPVVEEAPAF